MNDSWTDVTTVDRRRHERLRPSRQVKIRCTEGVMSVFGWGETYEVPALLDLSTSGARLAMHEDPKVGSILCLDLKTDEGLSFEAIGEIRWSRPGSPGAGKFQCGVVFFNFTPRQRREIGDLLKEIHGSPEGTISCAQKSIPA